jgi:asparagine synthetase B (glutamine-hydrolysing)
MLADLLIVHRAREEPPPEGWREALVAGQTRVLTRGPVALARERGAAALVVSHHPFVDPAALARAALTRGALAVADAPAAVCVLDTSSGAFALTRDPLGAVPVTYGAAGGVAAAGTDPGATAAALGGGGRLDLEACRRCLEPSSHSRSARDLLAPASRLLPGHVLEWASGDGPRTSRWWDPRAPEPADPPGALLDTLREVLGPVFDTARAPEVVLEFSGGLDSSGVASLVARDRHWLDAAALRAPGFPGTDDGAAIAAGLRAIPARLVEVDMRGRWPRFDGELADVAPSLGPIYSATEELTEAIVLETDARARRAILVSGLGADQLFDVTPAVAARGHARAGDRAALASFARAYGRRELARQLALAALEPTGLSALARRARARTLPADDPEAARALAERVALAEDTRGWLLRATETWGWELMMRGLRRRAARSWPARHLDPFLDPRVWEVALSLGARWARGPSPRGVWVDKWTLRAAFARHGALHRGLVWRPKTTNFDGVVCQGIAQGAYDHLDVGALVARGLTTSARLDELLGGLPERARAAMPRATHGALEATRVYALAAWVARF